MKRIFCHSCKNEYVIESKKSSKEIKVDEKCKFCNNDFIHVEEDRGHNIGYRFREQDIIY